MKLDDVVKTARRLSDRYKVDQGKSFRLKDIDPADTGDLKKNDKEWAREELTRGIEAMTELQDRLYANDSWALLLIFQAMDAAGKDSAIKHVMSGVNPQGCEVYAFKQPSSEELDHDYLWRCAKLAPRRGHIGIFNRSYYEEVIVVRVHPELLLKQKLPPSLRGQDIWQRRHEEIRRFEDYLSHNAIAIRKFFLHVSKEEQRQRFLARLDTPEKRWKFSPGDVQEREHWRDYMKAYESAIQATATRTAPWYVVPADHKWFTRLIVASVIIETLASLKLEYPQAAGMDRRAVADARKALGEKS
jgi:PPK2 family polyphosphate:nucleotide phosphotransferase